MNVLVRNAAWLVAAEGVSRASRILAALALAYALSPALFGAAALVMTVAEFLRAPARVGTMQAIVRAPDADLPAVTAAAVRLNWGVHLGLGAVQCLLAHPLAAWFGAPDIAAPLIALSAVFALYPLAFGRVAMLHRAADLKAVAKMSAACLTLANLATAVLALTGFGLWSVVVPRLLSAVLWVILARRRSAPPPRAARPGSVRPILRDGVSILGSEMLKSARANLDKPLVGALLGMEALGYYAFASNLGLGLGQSLLKGFSDALFPHLCAARLADTARGAARRVLGGVTLAALALFSAQAVAAPVLVPLLFGNRWDAAIPALVLLCLSAIPRAGTEVAAQYLRAANRSAVEARWSLALTGLVLAAICAGSNWGIEGVAAGVLLAHALLDPLFARSVLHTPSVPKGMPHVV